MLARCLHIVFWILLVSNAVHAMDLTSFEAGEKAQEDPNKKFLAVTLSYGKYKEFVRRLEDQNKERNEYPGLIFWKVQADAEKVKNGAVTYTDDLHRATNILRGYREVFEAEEDKKVETAKRLCRYKKEFVVDIRDEIKLPNLKKPLKQPKIDFFRVIFWLPFGNKAQVILTLAQHYQIFFPKIWLQDGEEIRAYDGYFYAKFPRKKREMEAIEKKRKEKEAEEQGIQQKAQELAARKNREKETKLKIEKLEVVAAQRALSMMQLRSSISGSKILEYPSLAEFKTSVELPPVPVKEEAIKQAIVKETDLPPPPILPARPAPLVPGIPAVFKLAPPVRYPPAAPVAISTPNPPVRAVESLWVTRGLQNLGETCFMNAVLQALLKMPKFVDFFRARVEPFSHPVTEAVRLFVHEYYNRLRTPISPSLLSAYRGKYFPDLRSGQHDAQEYVNRLLGMLDDDQKTADAPSFVHQIFGFLFQSMVFSDDPDKSEIRSIKYDVSQCLTVQVPQKGGRIRQLIIDFMREERLDAQNLYKYYPDEKNKDVYYFLNKKRITVVATSFPNVLIVHLGRFTTSYTGSGFYKAKNHALVTYPIDMNLVGAKYKLRSFILHEGNGSDSGHYYAIVRHDNGIWVEANDDTINGPLPLTTVENNPFAYVLFYEKIEESSI